MEADGFPLGEGHGACEGGCGAERLYGESVPCPAEKRGGDSRAGQGGSDGEGQPEDGGHERDQGSW